MTYPLTPGHITAGSWPGRRSPDRVTRAQPDVQAERAADELADRAPPTGADRPRVALARTGRTFIRGEGCSQRRRHGLLRHEARHLLRGERDEQDVAPRRRGSFGAGVSSAHRHQTSPHDHGVHGGDGPVRPQPLRCVGASQLPWLRHVRTGVGTGHATPLRTSRCSSQRRCGAPPSTASRQSRYCHPEVPTRRITARDYPIRRGTSTTPRSPVVGADCVNPELPG